jgi:tRNA threonylcarbamoyladenosine biosynthesis protein TsaB
MARIICIETATESCSVALAIDGIQVASHETNEGFNHAAGITLFIDQVLNMASLTYNDIDAVAVSMGPGSYTGLRVGVSTAKGICFGLGIPLIAVSTLQSLATVFLTQHADIHPQAIILPMLDARRMEVYCAAYDVTLKEIKPVAASIIDAQSFADLLQLKEVHFIGNATQKCSTVISHERAFFHHGILCSAKGMCLLAQYKYDAALFEDVAYFEPYYLKDFVSTTPKQKAGI